MEEFVSHRSQRYWNARRSINGAFWDTDFLIFDRLLEYQRQSYVSGDLLEIGAYLGKSAILAGLHTEPEETMWVCDLFGGDAEDYDNENENAQSYPGLSREAFELNYQDYNPRLCQVIPGPSSLVADTLKPGSLRFAHVDGSHLFDIVTRDLADVRGLLRPDGILVIDDYREHHTPGVAAAAWRAVHEGEFVPFCLTSHKMYCVLGASVAQETVSMLTSCLDKSALADFGLQDVAGCKVLITGDVHGNSARELARKFVPPIALTAVEKRRRGRRHGRRFMGTDRDRP